MSDELETKIGIIAGACAILCFIAFIVSLMAPARAPKFHYGERVVATCGRFEGTAFRVTRYTMEFSLLPPTTEDRYSLCLPSTIWCDGLSMVSVWESCLKLEVPNE